MPIPKSHVSIEVSLLQPIKSVFALQSFFTNSSQYDKIRLRLCSAKDCTFILCTYDSIELVSLIYLSFHSLLSSQKLSERPKDYFLFGKKGYVLEVFRTSKRTFSNCATKQRWFLLKGEVIWRASNLC